jgi:hypothetical protein
VPRGCRVGSAGRCQHAKARVLAAAGTGRHRPAPAVTRSRKRVVPGRPEGPACNCQRVSHAV